MDMLADYFCGRVGQREYACVYDFEFGTVSGGIVSSAYRNLVVARTVEQTFRFEGVPASLVDSSASVTVSDVGGKSYTFAPVCSFTDGSTGSRVFEVESVNVARVRMSPHMWELTVTRRGVRYFINGTRLPLVNEPAWLSAILG